MTLVVYKSSAGSGKTATLVYEYLRLCLNSPREFKHILAITFTNKAANEMKSRIISTLENGQAGNKDFILEKLKKEFDYNDDKLKESCNNLLTTIIHNYDEFAISTIDSFVHRIIRTFASEVNLPANFEVILDKDDIIPEIIDKLFNRLGSDKNLTKIMLSFVLKQIEEEKSHDLGSIVSTFIDYNLSEDVFEQKEFLSKISLDQFIDIIKKLSHRERELKNSIESSAKSVIDLFNSVGLDIDDIIYKKSGPYNYFYKLQQIKDDKDLEVKVRILQAVEEDKWLGAKADAAVRSSMDSIKEQIIGIFYSMNTDSKEYLLYRHINSQIFSVALASEIQLMFTEFIKLTSKVHISEFNKRISESIADQPVPFLYERLGYKYKHYLIDEFQDTSVLQWDNLLPLVEESLANNNFNMLVGDAKQAIYRFRNGEVELFTHLPKLYNAKENNTNGFREVLFENQFEEKFLDVNYRSNKHIVQFNNEFFSFLKGTENDLYKKNYNSNEQKLFNDNSAFVHLELLDSETKDEFNNRRRQNILKAIEQCLSNGYRAGDICILSRTKKQLTDIANYLIDNNHKIVSSESLLISKSPEVSLLIAFLQLLIKPDENLFLAGFIFKYAKIKGIEQAELIYQKLKSKPGSYLDAAMEYLDKEADFKGLMSLSIYEICEFAIRLFDFDKKNNAFLQGFLNFAIKAQASIGFTLIDFLEYWDKKNKQLFIDMPNDENAIKLMTAHKSKGLDFKVVIADLHYNKTYKSKVFWADIDIEDLKPLSKTMLPLKKSLESIGLHSINDIETSKGRLDFLNLVYVSFTRASEALFAFASTDVKDNFGSLLKPFIESKEASSLEYTNGELKATAVEHKTQTNIKDLSIPQMISTKWQDIISIAEAEDVYWDSYNMTNPATFGKLVHRILAEISYESDVSKAILQHRNSGLIDEKESKQIDGTIQTLISNPKINRYFQKDCIVKNETELIDINGKIIRPDRVVLSNGQIIIIDYKTGKKDEKHRIQLESYSSVFSSLGYLDIKCFLVYLGVDIFVDEIMSVRI